MSRVPGTGSTVVKPRARREGLVVRELTDEVVVYDLRRHEAHCLNALAASVWRACDGNTGVKEIAGRLGLAPGPREAEALVWIALDRLADADLLEGDPRGFARSRRALLGRLSAAAALCLPVVTTLLVPEPAAAATCVPLSQPCSASSQCCPNNQNLRCCRNGVCAQGAGNCAPG